jgi:hypothetical protein
MPGLLALFGAALVTGPFANAEGNAGTTFVATFDPTGAAFTCPGTNYTVLGDTLRFVFHDSIAADGSEHLTSTHVPLDVTLRDGTTSMT